MTVQMEWDSTSAGLVLNCFQKALGHELPNLLVAAQGLTRFLLTEIQDTEQHQLLERIAQSLLKTDALVRRLATLGRLQREPVRLEMVSLTDLVEEVAAEVRSTRGMPSVRPTLGPLPTLLTDHERLRQVLLVVLRNAFQSELPNVPLVVRVFWDETARELTVTDNGRGIPDFPSETFLQPFRSGSTGQGLGLFTANLLISDLKGCIALSRIEVGTAVRLLLPSLECNSQPVGPP